MTMDVVAALSAAVASVLAFLALRLRVRVSERMLYLDALERREQRTQAALEELERDNRTLRVQNQALAAEVHRMRTLARTLEEECTRLRLRGAPHDRDDA